MSVLLKIFPEQRLVLSEFYGELSEDEFLQHGRAIKAHPGFDPSFSEIVDFTRVTEFHISDTTLQRLAAAKSVFNPESKHAVIASTAPVYELARIFQTQADSRILAVVQTREQACSFLGIDSIPT